MEDKTEKFIQGKLSNKEHETHEGNLSADVSKEMAFEVGVRKGVEEAVRNELREKVGEFESRRSSRRIRPWHLGIAASILLIATFTFLLNDNSKDLYGEYYEPYPNYEVTVLRGEDENALMEQAYRAYDEANYELAAEKFAELLESKPEDVPTRFFYGISLMEGQKFEAAIANFNPILESNNEYATVAKWYSALCYIRIENKVSAVSLLDQLKESEDFGERARKLKQEL